MAEPAQIEISADLLSQAVADLARITGISAEVALKSEVQAIMQATVNRTAKAKKSSIQKRYKRAKEKRQFFFKDDDTRVILMSMWGGMVRDLETKKSYMLKWRLPSDLWRRVQIAEYKRLAQLLDDADVINGRTLEDRTKAIGLSARTWYEPAMKAGLLDPSKITSADKVATAASTKHSLETASISSEEKNGKIVSFNIRNATWAVGKADSSAAWAFETSIRGRESFYIQNINRGVFQSLADISRAYPGLKIS